MGPTFQHLGDGELREKPLVVLANEVVPKDFLTVAMPAAVRNRRADDRMLRNMVQLGWHIEGVVGRTAYFSRPHDFKN
jgi:hypothetical protein